ncbi:hypothetical protein BJX70DRAFT_403220 [Aspergillus crustosus]
MPIAAASGHWGMDGSRDFGVHDLQVAYQRFIFTDLADDTKTSEKPESSPTDKVGSALRVLPPRPYLDALVQSYLSGPNYQYYIIYPPAFSREYASWWEDRVRGRAPDRSMTCLLLQLCACSTQAPSESLRTMLETELGENIPQLSRRYHNAARSLSNSIRAGKGGLAQIQQLFLTSWWLKGDAQYVDSWHILAAAIHEAQEQGPPDMQKHRHEHEHDRVDEFELETRRRHQQLQVAAVQCALDVADSSAQLAQATVVDATNFHTAVFTLFDAAATLCSSILHDKTGTLPQRAQVIEAIGQNARKLKQLAEIWRTASTAYHVLRNRIRSLGLACNEADRRRGEVEVESAYATVINGHLGSPGIEQEQGGEWRHAMPYMQLHPVSVESKSGAARKTWRTEEILTNSSPDQRSSLVFHPRGPVCKPATAPSTDANANANANTNANANANANAKGQATDDRRQTEPRRFAQAETPYSANRWGCTGIPLVLRTKIIIGTLRPAC